MRDFWDFAWSYPAPVDFVRYGVDAASYTGAARAERSYYDALRANGTDVLMIQETTNERAQEGYQAGVYDVQFARRRSREVGHLDSAPIAYAVSDGSRDNPTWNGDAIADYGQAVGDNEVGPYKFYGNRYAVDAACAGARRSRGAALCLNLIGGWVPRTWNFDPARDTAAQEVGGTPIAGIDVNTTYRPIFTPGPAPEPDPEHRTKGSGMNLVVVKGSGYWVGNGQFWVVAPDAYAKRVGINPDGSAQSLEQVLSDWGWLPTGALPAAQVDEYVTLAIASAVRNKKLDKSLAAVTLP